MSERVESDNAIRPSGLTWTYWKVLPLFVLVVAFSTSHADAVCNSIQDVWVQNPSLNFGTVTVGNPKTLTAVVRNDGYPECSYNVSLNSSVPAGFRFVGYGGGFSTLGSTVGVIFELEAEQAGSYQGTVQLWFGQSGYTLTLAGQVVCPSTPTASFTSPTNGSTVTPNASGKVVLNASASDSTGIQRVDFFVDSGLVASDFTSPYTYAWPATTGSHSANAKAYSQCGTSTTSNTNSFTVVSTCNFPTVSFTSPANGATVTPNAAGKVVLSASASDASGIQKVEFYVDGGLVATDQTSPYAYAWPASSGSHSAYAKAYNNCGKNKTSNTNTFTVN